MIKEAPSASVSTERDVFDAADLYDPARKIGLQMLRRSFCSHSLSHGASIKAVRAMGGWSSRAVLQRYAVSVEDEQRLAGRSLTLRQKARIRAARERADATSPS